MRARLAIAVACVAFGAAPVLAAEDAGTRSVFAAGAGNRALAMGGAFAAVADDASAAIWNPGGLGLLTRTQLELTRTGYALGFQELYGSMALPSWRWGTANVTVRHFTAEGIERRDDRNVLLEEDLSDAETEIALGYGRSLGAAWSLGGTVKLQRQNLAGFSGSGLGADLGVLVRPLVAAGSASPTAERLSLGLAVRNVIEPRIRLDRESVGDPSTMRAGAAYRGPRFTLAADLEKSADVGAHFHGGLEVTPHPLLALRAGVNDGALTAGAGVRWQDAGFDYAFEDSPLETVHRVGLQYAFGPTVRERRDLALQRQEEELQARLAESFQAAQAERIAGLLDQARAAREDQRLGHALDLVGTALTLEPSHAEAGALHLQYQIDHAAAIEADGDFAAAAAAYGRILAGHPEEARAQAGEARCRAESDRRTARSQEIREHFGRAMDAFAADDLAAARRGFVRILELAPGDGDAREMLRRTDLAVARRVESLLRQAQWRMDAERLTEASDLLEQARSLDSQAEGLAQALARLSQARGQARATARAETGHTARPTRPALSAQEKREVEDLYRRGVAAMRDRRPDEALGYWELVWAKSPGYASVDDYLKREYLTRGLNAFSAGRLDDAVGLWEKALRIDPDDDRARGYLARAQQQQARAREILGATR